MSLLAAIDLESFFNNKPLRVTKKKLQETRNLINPSDKVISSLFEPTFEKPVKSKVSLENYSNYVDLITDTTTVEEYINKFNSIQDQEVQSDIIVELTQMKDKLNSILPSNQSVSLFGVEDREPSDYEKSKFIRSLRVLDDPTYVLDLLRQKRLTQTEVNALQLFYPEVYETWKFNILDTLTTKKTDPKFKLDRSTNQQFSVFFQVPMLTSRVLSQLQSSYGDSESQSSSVSAPEGDSNLQTETQRITFE